MACGVLCELVQMGTSMSWQPAFSSITWGLVIGLAGLAPTANYLGGVVFDKLTHHTLS
jgi:hypothetical protein